jgi:hypothetical protein
MPATAYVVGLIFILQALGCTAGGTKPEPGPQSGGPVVTRQQPAELVQSQPIPVEPVPTTVSPAAVTKVDPLPEQQSGPQLSGSVGDAPVVEPFPAASPPEKGPALKETPAETVPPAAKPPVKVAIPPPVPKPVVAAPVRSEPPALPALALATLEQRLKDTDAVGVFTKLALKNQIDDLLGQIRAHHEGRGKFTLTQLRQSYDQLLLKVHDLLKKGDPPLASAIMNSRESIWIVLTDPVRFAKL